MSVRLWFCLSQIDLFSLRCEVSLLGLTLKETLTWKNLFVQNNIWMENLFFLCPKPNSWKIKTPQQTKENEQNLNLNKPFTVIAKLQIPRLPVYQMIIGCNAGGWGMSKWSNLYLGMGNQSCMLKCWWAEMLKWWDNEMLKCLNAELLKCWHAEILNYWNAEM